MIKKAAAAALGVLTALSLAGCSKMPEIRLPFSGDPTPDYESGTTEEEFQGITYQVPSSWQSQEAEDGNTVYYYPDSGEEYSVSIILQYSTMDEELWEEGETALLHSLAYDYESLEGVSDFEQKDASLGDIPVVKITCVHAAGGDGPESYDGRYVLIPVNRKAVLTVASAVPEDADNSYRRDFEHIWESIEIPKAE